MATKHTRKGYIPHEVVSLMVKNDWTVTRAWREHLGVTQQQVANRLDISLRVYVSLEETTKLARTTREKIAASLRIASDLLDV